MIMMTKKRGRPVGGSSRSEFVMIRFSRRLTILANAIAEWDGRDRQDVLTELATGPIERRYAQIAKERDEAAKETDPTKKG